jgi:hypothetical protein
MDRQLGATKARNLLAGAGAYYLSWFVANPLAMGFGKLTKGITYYGDFAGGVLMPIIISLPYVLVAAAVGASVVWMVESDRPIGWTLVPTFLYALGVFHPSHWALPPTPFDRVGDFIRVLLPAFACGVAGIVAAKRLAASHVSRSTPG